MHSLSRSTALKIAAVVMTVLSIVDIIMFEIPGLIAGQAAVDAASIANDGPPFFMVIVSFTIDVLALVAAYGAWNKQRWGVVLLIITAALTALPGLGGMLFAPDLSTRIIAGISIILCAGIIVLCLWRDRRPATSGVTAPSTH